jgi:foldase protein PrsA
MAFLYRKLIPLLLLALALFATGCGSDDDLDVPSGAVAVVGEREIPKSEFDALLEQAEANFQAQKQEFPQAGTPEYENLKNSIVRSLVERAQWEQKAGEMGIQVTDAEVTERLDGLKEQSFQGDEEAYRAELEKAGLTEKQLRDQIRSRILSEKIFKAVTKTAQVSDEDVSAYYESNKAQFQRPQSRDVRHILVKKEARAAEIRRQLTDGASFAKLAKEFSQDTTSAADGGKLTVAKGETVAPFDKFVFDAKKGELSQPIETDFGWHVIEVLSAVKPAAVTPLEEVEESIRQTLLQQKQNEAMRKWVNDLEGEFEDQIAYAPGFAPPPQEGDGTTTQE